MDISKLVTDSVGENSNSEPVQTGPATTEREEAAVRPSTPESWPDNPSSERNTKRRRGESSRVHTCRQCSSSFTTHSNLVVHVQTVHEGLRPYVCELCNRSFGTKGTMNRHVRLVHYHERRYVCQLCGRTFATLACLRRHHGLLHGSPT